MAERVVVRAREALRARALEASLIASVFATVLAGRPSGAGARGARRRQVLAAGMADEVGADAESGEHYGNREHRDHPTQAESGNAHWPNPNPDDDPCARQALTPCAIRRAR